MMIDILKRIMVYVFITLDSRARNTIKRGEKVGNVLQKTRGNDITAKYNLQAVQEQKIESQNLQNKTTLNSKIGYMQFHFHPRSTVKKKRARVKRKERKKKVKTYLIITFPHAPPPVLRKNHNLDVDCLLWRSSPPLRLHQSS